MPVWSGGHRLPRRLQPLKLQRTQSAKKKKKIVATQPVAIIYKWIIHLQRSGEHSGHTVALKLYTSYFLGTLQMPFRENQCVHIPVPSHTYTEPSAESPVGLSDPALCKWQGEITQTYKYRGDGLLFTGPCPSDFFKLRNCCKSSDTNSRLFFFCLQKWSVESY